MGKYEFEGRIIVPVDTARQVQAARYAVEISKRMGGPVSERVQAIAKYGVITDRPLKPPSAIRTE